MKPVTETELKEIFADNDELTLSFDSREEYKTSYCYVKYQGSSICCLRGQISESPIFDDISYMGYNSQTRQIKHDTRDECRNAFMNLPKDKQSKIFDILGLPPLSEYERSRMRIQQEETKRLEEMLAEKPKYAPFHGNQVLGVGMRKELILESSEASQYIGTLGLGPCIGVALISKKDGKVNRVGVTHIDALTDLNSIESFVYRATKDADEVGIVMISSQNERTAAQKILKSILINPKLRAKAKVASELDGSTSFAVNLATGSVYKDIPANCFVGVEKANVLELGVPGPLKSSELYQKEKRESLKNINPISQKTFERGNGR